MKFNKLYYGSAGLVCLVAMVSFMLTQPVEQKASVVVPLQTTTTSGLAETHDDRQDLDTEQRDAIIAALSKSAINKQEVDLGEPEPETAAKTIIELQNADVTFASVAEINAFITEMEYRPNVVLMPLVEALTDNPALMESWLSQLVQAADGEVSAGTEVVLSNLPKQNFLAFVKKSLAYGGDHVRDFSITALSRRNDVDLAAEGLSTVLTELVVNESVGRYTKMSAMTALTNTPESYSQADRSSVTSAVETLTLSNDDHLRSSALTAMLKLNSENGKIEPAVMAEISHQDPSVRKKALISMDQWMELGVALSPSSVSLIHYQVLLDLSLGGTSFREKERESYVDTASYVLSNMVLSPSQIYEMKAAGIPYQEPESRQNYEQNEQLL
jgi:hypothetical protein